MERTDRELLDRYIAHRDDAAFRELVKRHLPLVHGVARRVTCGDDLARDVSQEAFLRLARRAALIPPQVSLPAWLHRVSRQLAIDQMRGETRRRKREMAAISSHEAAMQLQPAEANWNALSPMVDQLVDALPAADREMVLARFYRNEPHAVIARRLGLSEALARKRTSRALEKLRALLGKKGIATSSSALAVLLPAHAATPVPPLLMTSIAGAVAGVAPHAPGAIPSLLLTMNTVQKSAVAAAALLFLVSLGYSITGPSAAASSRSVGAASSTGGPAVPPRRARTGNPPVDLNRLRDILDIPNAAIRRREAIAFIDRLTPGQFPEVVDYLRESRAAPDTPKIEELALTAWGRVDPHTAVGSLTRGMEVCQIVNSWVRTDPEAALAWAHDHSSDDWNGLAIGVRAVLAGQDPAAILKELHEIPDPARRTAALTFLQGEMERQEQPGVADRLLELLTDPAERALVAKQALNSDTADPLSAARLLATHPDFQNEGFEVFFQRWAAKDFPAARSFLDTLPASDFKDRAGAFIALSRAQRSSQEGLKLARQYPGGFNEARLEELILRTVGEDAAGTLEFARQVAGAGADEAVVSVIRGRLHGFPTEQNRQWLETKGIPPRLHEAILRKDEPATK